MSATTSIEWTDRTWNPVRGCSLVSAGCTNCYAMRQAHRQSGEGAAYEGLTRCGPNGPLWTGTARLVPEALADPLRWRKPQRIFVNSMSDLFHESLSDQDIDKVFLSMALAPHHTFQILTKRPARMLAYCGSDETFGRLARLMAQVVDGIEGAMIALRNAPDGLVGFRLPNAWLGVSVEDQATARERIPILTRVPAAIRFVSYEPALGPIQFNDGPLDPMSTMGPWSDLEGIDWLIVGGESGPRARPCNVEWIRSAIQQCREYRVAVFVKQLGAKPVSRAINFQEWHREGVSVTDIGDGAVRPHLLDRKGGDPAEWPVDLRIREFPAAANPAPRN